MADETKAEVDRLEKEGVTTDGMKEEYENMLKMLLGGIGATMISGGSIK